MATNCRQLLVTFLLAMVGCGVQCLTTSVTGFYRIEVEFGKYENVNGHLHNTQSCDEITPCDPIIYTYIDVERPSAPWANAVRQDRDLTMLTWRRNVNSYDVNQTIHKDVCGGALSNVNARVEVMDEDFLGKYDLIEQFECKFFPGVADTNSNQDPAERDYFRTWSPMEECAAKHLPTKIRLFYRWRVYPIEVELCGGDPKAVPALTTATPLTTTPLPFP